MTDRDRLIELIVNADVYDSYECKLCTKKDTSCTRCGAGKLAEHLLANGVIVPPCKVGDIVYYIEGAYYNSQRKTVRPIKVTEFSRKCDRSGRDLGIAIVEAEHLQEEIREGSEAIFSLLKKAKVETVNLFAERLKSYLNQDDFETPSERWRPESEFAKLIDNIVKEIRDEEDEEYEDE